jgi:hypothetical protein
MVAALDYNFHSLFRGRKPERREDRSKRARRFSRNGCCPGRRLPLALLGKEALKEGGRCTETKTTARRNRELANPSLEVHISSRLQRTKQSEPGGDNSPERRISEQQAGGDQLWKEGKATRAPEGGNLTKNSEQNRDALAMSTPHPSRAAVPLPHKTRAVGARGWVAGSTRSSSVVQ